MCDPLLSDAPGHWEATERLARSVLWTSIYGRTLWFPVLRAWVLSDGGWRHRMVEPDVICHSLFGLQSNKTPLQGVQPVSLPEPWRLLLKLDYDSWKCKTILFIHLFSCLTVRQTDGDISIPRVCLFSQKETWHFLAKWKVEILYG